MKINGWNQVATQQMCGNVIPSKIAVELTTLLLNGPIQLEANETLIIHRQEWQTLLGTTILCREASKLLLWCPWQTQSYTVCYKNWIPSRNEIRDFLTSKEWHAGSNSVAGEGKKEIIENLSVIRFHVHEKNRNSRSILWVLIQLHILL